MEKEFINYSVSDEIKLFRATTELLGTLHILKSESYGCSWRKRGSFSALFQVLRKTDRLENIYLNRKDVDNVPGEDVIMTVMDLAAYSILWFGLLVLSNPEKVRGLLKKEGMLDHDIARFMEVLSEIVTVPGTE